MKAIVPDASQVNRVLNRLASNSPVSDAELNQVLAEAVIRTGLDHWSLWTLVCLRRHLDRQRWVGYIVESRLKGELRQIGCAGAFGHPERLPQSGKVPDEPDWRYFFHGCGCCLTNEVTGVRIDVDFTREGDSSKIDRFFYSDFLLSLSDPEFPERLIRGGEPLEDSWQVEIDRLGFAGCVQAEHGVRLTSDGLQIAEVFEPLSTKIAQLLEWETAAALRGVIYAALAVGDVVLASQLVSQADIGVDLQGDIAKGAEREKQSRLGFLQTALQKKPTYAPSCLAALADLGPQFAEEIITRCLFQSPVDGRANTALQVLRAWDRPNLGSVLRELLHRRYKEANGLGSIFHWLGIGVNRAADLQPRNYQVTQATIALFQRVRCEGLDSDFRAEVRFLIENAGGAQAGEAGLLLYLFDQPSGLHRLRQALSGSVPVARQEAAAACVIIGSEEARKILEGALSSSDQQTQHIAACALAAFPGQDARASAGQWFARNDGIKDPLGKEVTLFGQTKRVFTMDEISHSNMDGFFKWSLEKLRKDFKSVL